MEAKPSYINLMLYLLAQIGLLNMISCSKEKELNGIDKRESSQMISVEDLKRNLSLLSVDTKDQDILKELGIEFIRDDLATVGIRSGAKTIAIASDTTLRIEYNPESILITYDSTDNLNSKPDELNIISEKERFPLSIIQIKLMKGREVIGFWSR